MTERVKRLEPFHPPCRWIVDANGCWVWTLRCAKGYGVQYLPVLKDKVYVYMTNWVMKFGPLPVGYQLDHTCKNRACVNPDHLEAVPQAENLRRGKHVKYSMEIARKIRAEYAEIKGQRGELVKLARRHKIDTNYVKQIVYNHVWREESNWKGNR